MYYEENLLHEFLKKFLGDEYNQIVQLWFIISKSFLVDSSIGFDKKVFLVIVLNLFLLIKDIQHKPGIILLYKFIYQILFFEEGIFLLLLSNKMLE